MSRRWWLFLVASASAFTCHARLGETETQASARYGDPLPSVGSGLIRRSSSGLDAASGTNVTASNWVVRTYQKNEIKILASFFASNSGTNIIGKIGYVLPPEMRLITLVSQAATNRPAEIQTASNSTTTTVSTNRLDPFAAYRRAREATRETFFLSTNTVGGNILTQLLNANSGGHEWREVAENKYDALGPHYVRNGATATVFPYRRELVIQLDEFTVLEKELRQKQLEERKQMGDEKAREIQKNLHEF